MPLPQGMVTEPMAVKHLGGVYKMEKPWWGAERINWTQSSGRTCIR